MNIGTAAAAVLAAVQTAENVIEQGPVVLNFIHSAVLAAEQTGKTGEDKLTAVLNSTEVFANSFLPEAIADVSAFMAAVAAFVTQVVSLWNEVGIFVHGLAVDVGLAKA